jgi:DNA invertase Pin-like site-specific DNA recombinase
MTELLVGRSSPWGLDPWGERMLAPDEVAQMVRLHQLGWGTRRIAGELGCSRNTVKRYLAAGRLGGDSPAAPAAVSRRARGVAKGALPAAPRQLRCGASGPVA